MDNVKLTLTDQATDCTVQALPCTEQNSNIINVKRHYTIIIEYSFINLLN